MRSLSRADRDSLQDLLLDAFRTFELDVSVGITKNGVAVHSQDERVDAVNIGEVHAWVNGGEPGLLEQTTSASSRSRSGRGVGS